MSVLHRFMSVLHRFAEDTGGASAIEYGLLISGISLAIFAVIQSLGQDVLGFYSKIEGGMGPSN